MKEPTLVGALAGESLYRNNSAKSKHSNDSSEPINLDNLLCIVDENCNYHSLSSLTVEEKKVELKRLGFSDKTISEAIYATPKEEVNPAERNTTNTGDELRAVASSSSTGPTPT